MFNDYTFIAIHFMIMACVWILKITMSFTVKDGWRLKAAGKLDEAANKACRVRIDEASKTLTVGSFLIFLLMALQCSSPWSAVVLGLIQCMIVLFHMNTTLNSVCR